MTPAAVHDAIPAGETRTVLAIALDYCVGVAEVSTALSDALALGLICRTGRRSYRRKEDNGMTPAPQP